MAKKCYVGVNGIAKNVKTMYVGVNGTPKKVLKGYVGVNGVPKLFFEDGSTPVVIPSWDSWSSVAGSTVNPQITAGSQYLFYKRNNKIAYFGVATLKDLKDNSLSYHVFFVSPDADATAFNYYASGSGTTSYSPQTSVNKNGISWSVCYFSQRLRFNLSVFRPIDCVLNTDSNPYEYDSTFDPEHPERGVLYWINLCMEQAALDLLDRVYSVPFHEDYQVGQTYNNLPVTDIRKTIRKIVGVQLFKKVGLYATDAPYRSYSDNIDTIIDTLMTSITNKGDGNGIVSVYVALPTSTFDTDGVITILHGMLDGDTGQKMNTLNKSSRFKQVPSTYIMSGFDTKIFEYYDYWWGTQEWDWLDYLDSSNFDWYESVDIDANGDVSYLTTEGWNVQYSVLATVGIQKYFEYDWGGVLTNIGIDL